MKKIFAVCAFLFGSIVAHSQANLLNAKSPEQIGKKNSAQLASDNDRPLPYGFVNDRDVLMAKSTWEFIDLDERINFPLYFPIDTINVGKDRRSLFDVLLKGIKTGKIKNVYGDDYFNIKKSFKDMKSTFAFIDTTNAGREEINNHFYDYYPEKRPKSAKVATVKKTVKGKKGKKTTVSVPVADKTPVAKVLDPQYINRYELTAQDISGYKVRGFWYFDKRQSELKYRIIAICPVAPEARDAGTDNPDMIELFWLFFPEIRDYLHDAKAFNEKNSAQPISFAKILDARMFSGTIYKEENVFGDRMIKDYMKDNAQNQLLESDRIKDKIRNFELDMWNY